MMLTSSRLLTARSSLSSRATVSSRPPSSLPRQCAKLSQPPPATSGRKVSTHAAAGDGPSVNTDAVKDAFNGSIMLPNGLVDLYVVLGIDDDATPKDIKRAYRGMCRQCHPDFMGEAGHNICILLNEAYETLMDPVTRDAYDAKLELALLDDEDDYTGELLSRWMPTLKPKIAKNEDPDESRGVFVDEFTCIGCKQCVWTASATFRMEPEHGKSRVFAQWLNTEDQIQASIECCPVDCIHWVDKAQLPALEYVTQVKNTERLNAGVLMMGQVGVADIFGESETYLKYRKEREERLAREAARAYSPAQEAQRRAAAQALKKKNTWGGLGSFEDALAKAFGGMGGSGYVATDPADFQTVGRRKRNVRWDDLQRMQVNSGSRIPLERALVPLSVFITSE